MCEVRDEMTRGVRGDGGGEIKGITGKTPEPDNHYM